MKCRPSNTNLPESKSNIDELDLLSLPFKSTYRVLSWEGVTNGVLLTPNFSMDDIVGRILIIKSFKIVPYYSAAGIDMYVTDGITTNSETVPNNARVDRLFDRFNSGTTIRMSINGSPLSLFNAKFPLDVDLQNIYYKYPEKISSIVMYVIGAIFSDIILNTVQTPNIVVNMEVYLI